MREKHGGNTATASTRNAIIWGTENPHVSYELELATPRSTCGVEWPVTKCTARSFLRRKLRARHAPGVYAPAADASWGTGHHHLPTRRRSATLGSHRAGVFRRYIQLSLLRPWWIHPMAREVTGLDVSRLFRVGVRQVTCIRTKTTEWRWPPTGDHRGLCTDHSGNAARHVMQLFRAVWTAERPPRRSCCWVLICWDTKMVSLLQVYVSLTGNKVDSFLQRFRFFLWHLKRITLYIRGRGAW
jgi:hypothetical protein